MNGRSRNTLSLISGPIILITVGALFAINNFTQYNFGKTWPIILIVAGLLRLLTRNAEPEPYYPPQPPPPPPTYNAPPPPSQGPYDPVTGAYRGPQPPYNPPPAAGRGGFGTSAPPRQAGEPASDTPASGGTV